MWPMVRSPLPPSSVPAEMLIVERSGASQNRLEPQRPQKPRRARASPLALVNQRRCEAPSITRSSRAIAVIAHR